MILVDIDYKIDQRKMAERVRFVEDILDIKLEAVKIARTKKGYHYYFQSNKKLNNLEIVIMQLLLGSDYKREAFNFRRVKNGAKNWNVLFNKKYDSKGNLISYEKEHVIDYLSYFAWYKSDEIKRKIHEWKSVVSAWKT